MINVYTESGTKYQFNKDHQVRRIEALHDMRQDGEWLKVLNEPVVEVGKPVEMVIQPLGDPATCIFTTRVTSPVVAIGYDAE
jgi:hypothetical protein